MNPAQTSTPVSPPPAAGPAPHGMASIPVHSQAPAPHAPAPAREDEELDKIMHEVGNELKKDDKAPVKKHHFFERQHHSKPEPKFSAQPRPVMDVRVHAAPAASRAPAQVPAPRAARPQAQPKPAAAAPKPPKTSSAPVLAIFLTVIITGALTAAAVFAYK